MSSLVSLALRISAVRLLKNATLAGTRVFDSAVMPLDEMIGKAPEPFLVVSTEDEKAELSGRSMIGSNSTVDLVFDVAIASHIVRRVQVGEGEEAEQFDTVIPATDGGLEMSLALISRQITRALTYKAPHASGWGEVFKALVPSIKAISSKRGAGSANGVKFSARQIIVTLEPVMEPDFGRLPEEGSAFDLFLKAMEADAELASLAPLIRSEIVGEALPEYRHAFADLALRDPEAAGLGIAPLINPPEPPAALEEIEIEEVGIITCEAAEEQLP
jgi:hypothetical protein